MQLKRTGSIAGAIATMTSALLGSSVLAGDMGKLESSILLYSETNRVKAAEGIVSFSKYLHGERVLAGKLTLDGLTGASPSGATPSRNIQTFTRPSGQGGYAVAPGQIPLDDTFRDTRTAGDLSLSQPIGRLTTVVFGAHFSGEHDYTSYGVNGSLIRDLNRKNTTLGLSASFSHDIVRPEGGIKAAFTSMPVAVDDESDEQGEEDDEGEGGSTDSKDVVDLVVSGTQVLNRTTLGRLNYSYSRSSGYLNDPYKILTIVHDAMSPDAGEPTDYIFERRPNTHAKHSVYGELRHFLSGDVVDVSYRYFWDDWGTSAHTVDLTYRWELNPDQALQPHMRWYRQGAADFYRPFLVQGQVLPEYATADYRLGSLDAYTVGLQYFWPIHAGYQMSIGAEYYMQRGDKSPPEAFGSLLEFDLFPDMNALMVRVGFAHEF